MHFETLTAYLPIADTSFWFRLAHLEVLAFLEGTGVLLASPQVTAVPDLKETARPFPPGMLAPLLCLVL